MLNALPDVPVLVSPSSRRAGIEITTQPQNRRMKRVALLAEGGDRNRLHYICTMEDETVALLAEGGDRNNLVLQCFFTALRRPPRGGRG